MAIVPIRPTRRAFGIGHGFDQLFRQCFEYMMIVEDVETSYDQSPGGNSNQMRSKGEVNVEDEGFDLTRKGDANMIFE